MLLALVVQCGALATVTSATGLLQWHWLFKPLTMVIAIILVAIGAYESEARALFDSQIQLQSAPNFSVTDESPSQ